LPSQQVPPLSVPAAKLFKRPDPDKTAQAERVRPFRVRGACGRTGFRSAHWWDCLA